MPGTRLSPQRWRGAPAPRSRKARTPDFAANCPATGRIIYSFVSSSARAKPVSWDRGWQVRDQPPGRSPGVGCFIARIKLPEAPQEEYLWVRGFTILKGCPSAPPQQKQLTVRLEVPAKSLHIMKCHLERSLLSPSSSTLLSFPALVAKDNS